MIDSSLSINVVINVSEIIAESRPEMAKIVLSAAIKGASNSTDVAKAMIKRLRPNLMSPALAYIVKDLTFSLKQFNRN